MPAKTTDVLTAFFAAVEADHTVSDVVREAAATARKALTGEEATEEDSSGDEE
jgi:hypothetical protein